MQSTASCARNTPTRLPTPMRWWSPRIPNWADRLPARENWTPPGPAGPWQGVRAFRTNSVHRRRLAPLEIHLVDQPPVTRCLRGHVVVAVEGCFNFVEAAAGMPGVNAVHPLLYPAAFLGVQQKVRHLAALKAAERLMHQDRRIGQREAPAGLAGHQQE